MNKLFKLGDAYLAQCTWRDLALIKFCLASIGFIAALFVPREKRKLPFIIAVVVFLGTYIKLMVDFFSVVRSERTPPETDTEIIEF